MHMSDMMAIELIQPSPPPAAMPEAPSEYLAVPRDESYVEPVDYSTSPLPYEPGMTLDIFA